VQLGAVLEAAVHALAVEGHHRVRRVAKKHGLVPRGPVVAVDGAHSADRVLEELARHVRHQRDGVGKMPAEEIIDRVPAVERREAVRAAQWQKQRHCKAAVQVRQCDQHEAAARPDMQRMLLDLVCAGGRGGQRQFLVSRARACPP
jgi:hypothetical protein